MNNDTSFDIIQESNPVQTVAQPKEDNEMLRATDRITALYCRLSVEDTKEDKKNSKEDSKIHSASICTRPPLPPPDVFHRRRLQRCGLC